MRRLFILGCVLGIMGVARATPDSTGTLADLRAHRFDVIERRLDAIDASFKAGRVSEFDLLDAYKPFYQQDDVLSGDMAAWEREHPDSYVAHLANGTYRRKLGELRRGQGYIQQVPLESRHYMEIQFELSKRELWRTLELRPESFLALVNLMNIAEYTGDDAMADNVLALSVAAYPRNLLIRARYLAHLTPRWGGSAAEMDTFIEKSRASGVPGDVMRLLEAVRCDDEGFSAWEAHRFDHALTDYRRCMTLASGADPRFTSVYLLHSSAHCEDTGHGVTCQ
jgi:hypothetical protein